MPGKGIRRTRSRLILIPFGQKENCSKNTTNREMVMESKEKAFAENNPEEYMLKNDTIPSRKGKCS